MRIPSYLIESNDGKRYYHPTDDCFYEWANYDGEGLPLDHQGNCEELIASDRVKFRKCKIRNYYWTEI